MLIRFISKIKKIHSQHVYIPLTKTDLFFFSFQSLKSFKKIKIVVKKILEKS